MKKFTSGMVMFVLLVAGPLNIVPVQAADITPAETKAIAEEPAMLDGTWMPPAIVVAAERS